MNNGSGIVCIIALFVVFAIAGFVWRSGRGEDILDKWAQSEGVRIISRERRSLFTGPYFFGKSKDQDVYYVTVEHPDGRQRSGYVRVGGMLLGMMSNVADVAWDDRNSSDLGGK